MSALAYMRQLASTRSTECDTRSLSNSPNRFATFGNEEDVSFKTVSNSIQSIPAPLLSSAEDPNEYPDTPGVVSAEANALAKRKQANDDSHYTWHPQIAFTAQ